MLKIALAYPSKQLSDIPPLPIMILLAFLDVNASAESGVGKSNIGNNYFAVFLINIYKFLKYLM